MISIVVCTFNREKYLSRCLKHLEQQTADKHLYEIILVNNNSTDNTENIAISFSRNNPDIRFFYFFEPSQGLSHARNRGLNESKGDIIAFIDDDAFADREYVEKTAQFFIANTDTDGFGGKIIPMFTCDQPDWMGSWLMPLLSVLDIGNKVRAFGWGKHPVGANMGITRRAFETIGFFNTSLGRTEKKLLASEEQDFFCRMKQKGLKTVYLPQVKVHHIVPADRLRISFIKDQAIGIGYSERLRTINNCFSSYIKALLKEFFKWMATLLISVCYLFSLKPSKALMLIKYRLWVSLGLIKRKPGWD